MTKYEYDAALSFAGEDRVYVESVAEVLRQLGVSVFYDKYEEVDLWGKDLYVHLDEVYRKKAKYCVIFASENYAKKLWTNHERTSAQARAFESGTEYILPARFDNTEIPGIRSTTGYLFLGDRTPEQLALVIAAKVGVDVEIQRMIDHMKASLPDGYIIKLDRTNVVFDYEEEDYHNEFPVSVLLEMYRTDQLDWMFLDTSILPY
jgi:hypothetical protein